MAGAQDSGVEFHLIDNMSFGTVATSTSITISTSDPGAGRTECKVHLPEKTPGTVSFIFTLPGNLTSNGNMLPISFGNNSAAYNFSNCISGSTSFDPSQGLSGIQAGANGKSDIYLWIGATVSPVIGQAAGTYTGAIMVTGTLILGNGKTVTSMQTIRIRVKILPTLYLSASGTLDFGDIVAGSPPPSLSAQSDPNAPLFIAAGASGKRIYVSYHTTAPLEGEHGHTLQFRPSLYGSDRQIDQSSSTPVLPESNLILSGGSTGYYYFWLGGTLGPAPKMKQSGSYKGTFTLTVCY
jgi:hypothetical protein